MVVIDQELKWENRFVETIKERLNVCVCVCVVCEERHSCLTLVVTFSTS